MDTAVSSSPKDVRDLLEKVKADILSIYRVYTKIQQPLTKQSILDISLELDKLGGYIKYKFDKETKLFIIQEMNVEEILQKMNSNIEEMTKATWHMHQSIETLIEKLTPIEVRLPVSTPYLYTGKEQVATTVCVQDGGAEDSTDEGLDEPDQGNDSWNETKAVDFIKNLVHPDVAVYFQAGRMGRVAFNFSLFWKKVEATYTTDECKAFNKRDLLDTLRSSSFFIKDSVAKWKNDGGKTINVLFLNNENPILDGVVIKEERLSLD